MSYNNDIPQPGDLISSSQPQILGNFATIDTGTSGDPSSVGFSRNHYTMTDAVNGGLHYAVDFPNPPGSIPSPSGTQSSIYPNLVNSTQQLFFANAVAAYQLTNLTVTNSGNNYGIQTPWGLKLNWGRVSTSSSGASVTFAVSFSAIQSVVATGQNNNPSDSNVTVSAISTAGFTCYSSNASNAYYFAIGT